MKQVQSKTSIGQFEVSSSVGGSEIRISMTGIYTNITPIEAMEIASALLAHAERVEGEAQ